MYAVVSVYVRRPSCSGSRAVVENGHTNISTFCKKKLKVFLDLDYNHKKKIIKICPETMGAKGELKMI